MRLTNWFAITGGPCSGKSTVVAALQGRGYEIVEEVALILISGELAKGISLDQVRSDEKQFQRRILEAKVEIERKLAPEKIVFLDRGLPDSMSYWRGAGLDLSPVIEVSKELRYRKVFLFERLPMQSEGFRTEDDDQAELLAREHAQDYTDLGYELIRVPVMSVEERVKFIVSHI